VKFESSTTGEGPIMSKLIYKLISTDDRRFIFKFCFQANDAGTEFYGVKSLTIQYQKQTPPFKRIDVFQQDQCGLNIPISFSIKDNFECDNANIYGKVTCYLREEKLWIDGDYWYGLTGQEVHFEGYMAIYPSGSEPEPEPEPGPGPYFPPDNEAIIISDSRESVTAQDPGRDLFPYIYMRRWPRITAADLENNFIIYQESVFSPPPTLLYDILNDPTIPRKAKEKFAMDYINGDFAGGIPFLANVNFPGSLIKYLLAADKIIADYIKNHSQLTLYTFITAIANALNIPVKSNTTEAVPGESEEPQDYPREAESPGVKLEDLVKQIKEWLQSGSYLQQKERVWQSYFALIFVQGYDEELLEQLTRIIVTANIISMAVGPGGQNLSIENLKMMYKATIILPTDFFLMQKSSSPPLSIPVSVPRLSSPPLSLLEDNHIIPYAIGDLQVVKQQFVRYEAGEVAHIENVLKGEKKETRRRKLNRVSESSDHETVNTNLSESATADKQVDLSAEVLKTLTDNTIDTNYKNLKATYGSPNAITYDGSWTVTEPGQRKEDITKFARDVLNKTVNRINRQVTEIRRHSTLEEIEDRVTSIFDNTGSDGNLRGVYCWLNKVYSNYVINYGNRLMIEFIITDPAADYIKAESRCEELIVSRLQSPAELGIRSYRDISADKYADYAVICPGIEPPPPASLVVSATLRGDEEKLIQLPVGYEAKTLDIAYIVPPSIPSTLLKAIVGRNAYPLTGAKISGQPMNNETTAVPAAVSGNFSAPMTSPPADRDNIAANIEITCQPAPITYTQWQINTYNTINNHYRSQLKTYYGDNQGGADERRSQVTRGIIHEELRKGCMKLLFQELFRYNPGSVPGIIRVSELRYVQFFQQLFHWDEMYYMFHEEFLERSTPGKSRSDVYGYMNSDRTFCHFLQADYARVIVPVQPQNSQTTIFFLSAGMVWEGKDALVPALGSYTVKDGKNILAPDTGLVNKSHSDIEIINELKKITFTTGESEQIGPAWLIKVPTSLKILEENGDILNKKVE